MNLWLFIEGVLYPCLILVKGLIIVESNRFLLGTIPGMQRRQRHSLPATQAEYTVRQGFRIQTGNVAHFNRPTNGGSKKESTVGKFEGFSNNSESEILLPPI